VRNHLTVAQVNAATLGVDADQIRQLGHRMAPSSFGHLTERLFVLPVDERVVQGERIFVVNRHAMTNSTAIDLLQCLVGPAKLGKPIRCWLQAGGRWNRISVEHRTVTRVVTEYFA